MKTSNQINKAIIDIFQSLEDVFQKYTLSSRKKAWDRVSNDNGKKEIAKIIKNPKRQLNMVNKLFFKEWLIDQNKKNQ